MFIGKDPIRRSFIREVDIEGENCNASEHCLALDCELNKTPKEHLMHMLDMHEDEDLDEETAKIWGTESTIDSFLLFVKQVETMIAEGKVTSEEEQAKK